MPSSLATSLTERVLQRMGGAAFVTTHLGQVALIVVGVALAFGTEWGQAHLTTYRSGDPLDWVADVSALFISTLIVIIWNLLKQRK